MWQIMWKRRRTSTKWKKTAKNAIFVLVDKGLPKQFRDRPSYLSDPCGRNVTPTAAVCNLPPTFFFRFKVLHFGRLWFAVSDLPSFAQFVFICLTISPGKPDIRSTLLSDIWNVWRMICKLTRGAILWIFCQKRPREACIVSQMLIEDTQHIVRGGIWRFLLHLNR